MNANELYKQLKVDKDIVARFFILFSRFEYALKREKYACMYNNRVYVKWSVFAKDYNSSFNFERTDEIKSAVDYLEQHPPKKQILKNGTLGWKKVEKQSTLRLEQIICSVRRVRNNLFHGGKFPDGPIKEPGRNTELLESCIIILEACFSLVGWARPTFYRAG